MLLFWLSEINADSGRQLCVIKRDVFPSILLSNFNTELRWSQVSNESEILRKLRWLFLQLAILQADPFYCHRGTKARWANSFVRALDAIKESRSSVTVPFLTLHGTEDRLTNIEGSRLLHEQAMSTDKSYKVSLFQEIFKLRFNKFLANSHLAKILELLQRRKPLC